MSAQPPTPPPTTTGVAVERLRAFVRDVARNCDNDPEGEARGGFDSGPYCTEHGLGDHAEDAQRLLADNALWAALLAAPSGATGEHCYTHHQPHIACAAAGQKACRPGPAARPEGDELGRLALEALRPLFLLCRSWFDGTDLLIYRRAQHQDEPEIGALLRAANRALTAYDAARSVQRPEREGRG